MVMKMQDLPDLQCGSIVRPDGSTIWWEPQTGLWEATDSQDRLHGRYVTVEAAEAALDSWEATLATNPNAMHHNAAMLEEQEYREYRRARNTSWRRPLSFGDWKAKRLGRQIHKKPYVVSKGRQMGLRIGAMAIHADPHSNRR